MSERSSITARTNVVALIGDPIGHSLSPTIFNAAFDAAQLDWVCVALPVPAGNGEAAVAAMRLFGIRGLAVTMPHKEAVVAGCDELTPDGQALGAVNCLTLLEDGRIQGDSTDGRGFVRSLGNEGVDVSGRRVLVLGAGGAARSIILALGRGGARVTVAARRVEAARAAGSLARESRAVSMLELDSAASDADVIVNATPLGMNGEIPPLSVEMLHTGQFVADTVYHPLETPLLAAVRSRGIPAVNGVGMLIEQAVPIFERWTGRQAPVSAMYGAAQDVLRRAAARRAGH